MRAIGVIHRPVTTVEPVVGAGGAPRAVGDALHSPDAFDGGYFRISSTTANANKPDNIPVRRRVRLHDQQSGRVVRETWSNATTGAYAFNHIRQGTFYVTSFDHTGQYNAVIASNLTPEPMP